MSVAGALLVILVGAVLFARVIDLVVNRKSDAQWKGRSPK